MNIDPAMFGAGGHEFVANRVANRGRETIRLMLQQEHFGEIFSARAFRSGNRVEIGWNFKPGYDANQYKVVLMGYVVTLDPDDEKDFPGTIFRDQIGEGQINLGFEEGQTIFFELFAVNRGATERDIRSRATGELLGFTVSIPLSREGYELFKRARAEEENPSLKIRENLEAMMDAQDTFDEVRAAAVARIKAKNLSADDERRRLDSLSERIDAMKEEFGL